MEDREFFSKIGQKASDVYYVNEDMKKEHQEKQKGNAQYMAQELHHKHSA